MRDSGLWKLILAAVLALAILPAHPGAASSPRLNRPRQESSTRSRLLTHHDKAQLKEFFRLKKAFGDKIWPGFDGAMIPIVLSGPESSFLIGHPSPPTPWAAVAADTIEGRAYSVRESFDAPAFTVKIGDFWAGSIDTLDHMNRSMVDQIHSRVPSEKITPAFLKMMEITPPWHIVALLHEAFHALQATEKRARFDKALEAYALEDRYLFADDAFNAAWNKEGAALASALAEKDPAKKQRVIHEFLEIRGERRLLPGFSPELITFERELEWLEGLAKFVEMRFAEAGSTDRDPDTAKAYAATKGRLTMDFLIRLRKAGGLSGDTRFYLSGAAQAMLLDSCRPGWKTELWSDDTLALEDLLRAATK